MHGDYSGTVTIENPLAKRGDTKDGQACLILLHPPGIDMGKKTLLDSSAWAIGRDASSNLVIQRDSVSRRHAELRREEDGSWLLRDLGSTNGTFVNEERVQSRYLFDGDQIRFGDSIYKFLFGSNIESAYHEEIFKMSIVDGLTGIHNKRYFEEFLGRELAGALRHGTPLSLVLFDIDHFKQVNDDRGHLCGDAVLKQLCGRVRPRIRREDLFARYGGEEFVCVLGHTDFAGARHFAEHLRIMIAARPFSFDEDLFPVTVSAGVATMLPEAPMEMNELIQAADTQLYEAKNSGRNCVCPVPSGQRTT